MEQKEVEIIVIETGAELEELADTEGCCRVGPAPPFTPY